MNVLSLCDYTGNMVRPWVENGHVALIVDMQHEAPYWEGNPMRLGQDILALADNDIFHERFKPGIVFAFPPCTNLAVSGARWFRDKGLRGLIDGLELVEACRVICEASGAPYMIENPVSTLSTYWRQPDYIFNPCDYGGYLDPPGDHYTKKTCLWTGNGFNMPLPKQVCPVDGSKFHLTPPGDDRSNIRSETPMGFATAVYESNK